MKIHIVGGFLGSGKTTAIIAAARLLMQQGKRIGIVTNDQGKFLVDTHFFRLSMLPTVEVTGGCFCCNYDDLEKHLDYLRDTVNPDVIFAESVGSCADIIATVARPLLLLKSGAHSPASVSVFVDSRLLQMRLNEIALPFNDNVVYIFDKQIEEAGVLVVNKIDRIKPGGLSGLETLARLRYPDKTIFFQNSLDESSVSNWTEHIQTMLWTPPSLPLQIDYPTYGAGEAALAWFDEILEFQPPAKDAYEVTLHLLKTLYDLADEANLPTGHIKFLVQTGEITAKISRTALGDTDWTTSLPQFTSNQVKIIINARVETTALRLKALVTNAIQQALLPLGISYTEHDQAAFHPGYPTPTHRM
ncbi:MAG TPA: GTP-binding protein [Anaerolineaceae bacterium]